MALTFGLSDTRERYKSTLRSMELARFQQIEAEWETTQLGALFEDNDDRVDLSVRNTLLPMLAHDNRKLADFELNALLTFAKPEKVAGDIVIEIHSAYTRSLDIG